MFAAVTMPLSKILSAVKPASSSAEQLTGMLAAAFVPGDDIELKPEPAVDFLLARKTELPDFEYGKVMARLEERREAAMGAYPSG